MRILITGATGFIGRHLVQRLADDHEIIAMVRRVPRELHAGVRYVEQDLRNPLDRSQLPDTLDVIIHQAALIDADDAPDELPFHVNVIGVWRLLRYAADAGVQTFVHASTGGVYGCHQQPFVETDPPNPMDLYSLTKAQAELAVQAAPGAFHRIILRYFYPYGVGTPNPIPTYIERALTGEPIQVLASGGPQLNPVHISDAVEATVRVLALQEDITLNIAGTEVTTFREIAVAAAGRAGRSPNFQEIPDEAAPPYYQADLVADTAFMRETLKFMPQVSLQEGLTELIDYYMRKTLS